MEQSYDIAIIGSGPGGEGAATTLANKGYKVALIERGNIGGNSAHYGTIPSKALRHAVERSVEISVNPLFHHTITEPHDTFKHVRNASNSVIESIVNAKKELFIKSKIDLIMGQASFIDKKTIEIESDNKKQKISANKIIIATGSHPYHPDNVDFSSSLIHDSDSILLLDKTPRKIIIFGAGVIGSEYASIFNGLGCQVDLVDTRDQLLSFLDHEISEALSFYMREMGIVIHHNEDLEDLAESNNQITMTLKSGKVITADYLLWANGRSGNCSDLRLENTGIQTNSRGQIEVNQSFQTSVENIYAIGDIIGYPSLASAAFNQGRFAAKHIDNNSFSGKLSDNIPSGIYTIPEISSIGKTEKELTSEQIPFEVGRAKYKSLARAQIRNQTAGLLKILFHRETLEILGVHCFGYQASEILHIGQAVMASGDNNNIRYFADTTFNYPTMAEAYRIAALDGLSKIV